MAIVRGSTAMPILVVRIEVAVDGRAYFSHSIFVFGVKHLAI
jgi:hypothetical protein